MISNGNYAQYFPQSLQYIPGAYGASPYGAGYSGFGQELGSLGFGHQNQIGQQNQSIGAQLITALSQLANQVVAQGVSAQQVGALLGQLAQQIVALSSYGNAAFVPAAHAFNHIEHQLAMQGRVGQLGNAFGQSPYAVATPVGYGGFAPQMQVPQHPAWAFNRPAVLQ